VVTATRLPQDPLDIPAAIDRVDARDIAQDLQVSLRGFGARASFGVRGVRLIADGIPATMPDGQGQAASF
jgi:iron complex outermembrane receptor protein